MWLALVSACAGNVVDGLPREGGVEAVPDDPTGQLRDAGARDATLAPRDATLVGSRDAASSGSDAAPPPAQADSGSPSDPGTSATALNPGFLARPSNGRTFSSNPSDWAGSPRCNEGTGQGQVVFCDPFEAEASGGPPGPAWSVQGENATISNERALRGNNGARFAPASGAPGQFQETKTFPMLQNKLFGRVFVYFDSALPTTPSDAHWTLIQVGSTGPEADGTTNNGQVRLGGQVDPSRGNKNFFGVGSDGGDSGDWHTKGLEPESEVKQGVWTCLEWMFDKSNNETRVWINNVEQLSLHTTGTNYRAGDAEGGKQFVHPTYGYLRVGYWVYQPSTTPNPPLVYLDEVILDDEQIGCSL